MTKKWIKEVRVPTGQPTIILTEQEINPSYTPIVVGEGIAFGTSVSLISASEFDISELKEEIAAAKSQLIESQKQILSLQKQFTEKISKSQYSELVANIQSLSESIEVTQKRIEQVQDKSNQLTAPLVLPTPEDMKIGLVPTHWLDRLEEYRSDGHWCMNR